MDKITITIRILPSTKQKLVEMKDYYGLAFGSQIDELIDRKHKAYLESKGMVEFMEEVTKDYDNENN
jgi:hypothetical protein